MARPSRCSRSAGRHGTSTWCRATARVCVGAGAHFFGRSDEHRDLAAVALVEQLQSFVGGAGIVDEPYRRGVQALLDQFVADRGVHRKALALLGVPRSQNTICRPRCAPWGLWCPGEYTLSAVWRCMRMISSATVLAREVSGLARFASRGSRETLRPSLLILRMLSRSMRLGSMDAARWARSVMKSFTSWLGVMVMVRRPPARFGKRESCSAAGDLVTGDDVGEHRGQGEEFLEVGELADAGHRVQAGAGRVGFHGADLGGEGVSPVVDVGGAALSVSRSGRR